MSAKIIDDWEDGEDEDEDEDDFVPDDYDDEVEDEEGANYVGHDDSEDDPDNFPSLLEGPLSIDKTKGICYGQEGAFFLVCKTPFPAKTFTFEAPVIDSPLVFSGWIHDSSRSMKFEVVFSKEQMSKDPLQIQFLEEQEKKQLCHRSLTRTRTKTNNVYIDDNRAERNGGNLKAPPSYSLKTNALELNARKKSHSENTPSYSKAGHTIGTEEAEISDQKLNSRNESSDVIENDMKSSEQKNTMFVVTGSQMGNDSIDGSSVSFRGAYRCPSNASVEQIYLICPIQSFNGPTSATYGGNTAAVAASSRTRNRSASDDDSVGESSGVAYQELIDLHDDTRLSTEELRNRYYGSMGIEGEHRKNRTDKKRLKRTNTGNQQKKDDEEDDDDDAYGF